ncbi:MAG TPA: sugar phosphate isomerase/epimerase family protein [Gemmatimonadaceae bacterium]|nr:sugar phosphate isomerase/epimerase family protein [Gemmatimonadaceae bacterium]
MDRERGTGILTRREFVARAAAGAAVGALVASTRTAQASTGRRHAEPTIAVFSKHLQWLPLADVGSAIAESGFRAVDLTVRPGGHVLPERVEDDLPRVVETLRRSGLAVPLMTTAITDARDPLTRRVLTTARTLGVSHYRMGYWSFPANVAPLQALRELKPRAQELAALNREIGIRGGYQNHAGTRVGGSVWDLGMLLEGIEPDGLGVQYDICHATTEGGESWPMTLRMIAAHIDTIAVKDFHWAKRPDGRWQVRDVPLGEGMVNFPAYLRQLLAVGPLPPVTMHFEYEPLEMVGGGGAKRRTETVEGMRRDLTRFRRLLQDASAPAGASATSRP